MTASLWLLSLSWALTACLLCRPTPANRIAVQLTIKEAEELFDAWCRSTDFTFSSAVREHLFNLTDRQPGLLVAAFDWIEKMGLHNCSSVADMDAKVSELLLAPDFVVKCFASLRSLIRYFTWKQLCSGLDFYAPRFLKLQLLFAGSRPFWSRENEGEKRCACELLRLLVCMTEVSVGGGLLQSFSELLEFPCPALQPLC